MTERTNSLNLKSVATANQVHGRLWMGSFPHPGAGLSGYFDCLVLCAAEYQVPGCFPGMKVACAPMMDDGEPMRKEDAYESIRAAGRVIRWLRSGHEVLVTCYQGRNRSGLVTALALCLGDDGMSPDQAVAAIRAARGESAFRNAWFDSFLRKYVERQSEGTGTMSRGMEAL